MFYIRNIPCVGEQRNSLGEMVPPWDVRWDGPSMRCQWAEKQFGWDGPSMRCQVRWSLHEMSVSRETVWVRWSLHEMSGEMVPLWDVSEQRNSLGEMVPPWDVRWDGPSMRCQVRWSLHEMSVSRETVWVRWSLHEIHEKQFGLGDPFSEHWKTDFWCQNHLGERFTLKIWTLLWISAQWMARVMQTSTVCQLKCCTPRRSGSVVFCEWTNLSHRVAVSSDPCYVWTNLCHMLWVCCAPWCWTNVWTFCVCHVSVDTQHVLWIYRSLLVYTWKQFSEETW